MQRITRSAASLIDGAINGAINGAHGMERDGSGSGGTSNGARCDGSGSGGASKGAREWRARHGREQCNGASKA